jgi:DNA-binding MarR family transcriptional regulator
MTMRRNNSALAEETVNNLRRLFQVVNKQSKKTVLEAGLTGPQLWALKVLSDEADDSMTVSKLASRMCLNCSTVVRILDGLEAKALVQRVRKAHDRRIVCVSLTEKGCLIINESPNVAQNLLMNGLKTLSENKLYTIAVGLSQLVTILETECFPQQQDYAPKNI